MNLECIILIKTLFLDLQKIYDKLSLQARIMIISSRNINRDFEVTSIVQGSLKQHKEKGFSICFEKYVKDGIFAYHMRRDILKKNYMFFAVDEHFLFFR